MATLSKEISAKIHNKFDIEVIDATTGEVKERAQAFNIICNQLWESIFRSGYRAFATYIHYGSGSGTPAATDTSLFTFVGAYQVTEVGTNTDETNKVVSRICKIQLGSSVAVGVNLTEIGLAYGSASDALTTHAMLQDMNGNPISIQKTDTDIINIYATIYCHHNAGEATGIDISWNSNLILALTGASVSSYNILHYLTMGASRIECIAPEILTFTRGFDAVNRRITQSKRFEISNGNINGIFSILSSSTSGICVKKGTNSWSAFSITDESVGIGDGTTTKFKTKFNFPYNATVKINGIAVSSSNVDVKRLPVDTYGYVQLISSDSTDNNIKKIYEAPISRAEAIFYNTYQSSGLGLVSIDAERNGYSDKIGYVSNDLINWTQVQRTGSMGSVRITIPAEYRNYKYFKVADGSNYALNISNPVGNQDGYNIEFTTAPANGDVITIDYTTDCVPKDTDHVLDVTLSMQFGEYQGQ